ncbi:MAG: hypothetical protein IPG61_11215 [bacterium]|nr:hypothetical protein [bacterium]
MSQPRRLLARPGQRQRLLLAAIVVVWAGFVALRVGEAPVGSITDDAVYVETARSLAEGRGPVLAVGPDAAPANPGLFPPGFPLLLAPLALAFPASLAALKMVPLLAAALLLPLCWRLPGPGAAPRVRLALVALTALNPWVVGWSGRVLSDLPFTVLSLAALLWFEDWQCEAQPSPLRTVRLAGVTGLAMLVRSVGLALPLAMAAHLALERRWRRLGQLLAATAATQAVLWLPGWSGGNWLTEAYRSQLLGHSGALPERLAFMAANAWGYLRELPVALWPWFGNPARQWFEARGAGALYDAAQLATALLVVICCAAGWRALRGQAGAVGRARAQLWLLYLAFQALALVNFAGWPSGVQTRLLLPVLPLLYLLLVGGVEALATRGPRRLRGRLLPAACAVILATSCAHNVWRGTHPLHAAVEASGRGFVDPGVGADWLLANTDRAAVVMAPQPLQRHIHCRRAVIAPGDTLEVVALLRRARTYGAGWVLVGPSQPDRARGLQPDEQVLLAVLESRPDLAHLRWHDAQAAVWIFELGQGGGGAGDGASNAPSVGRN